MPAEQRTSEHDVRDAVQAIIDQLIAFDDATKKRVLRTVGTFFDVSTVPAHPAAVSEKNVNTQVSREPQFGDAAIQSPKDFLFAKQPATDVDRVACLAYYLTHFEDCPHFKTVDISRLNTEAAQMKFSNTSYAVTNAANAGFLVSAGKGQKQLSAMGEKYVEALPDSEAAQQVRQSMGKKRSKTKRKSNGKSA